MTELRPLLPFEGRFRGWMLDRGMAWEEEQLDCGGSGLSVGYRLRPAGTPERLVCAFHGAGNDALFGWVGLFKRLLLANSEIFTFDLPGHGRGCSTRFSAGAVSTAVEVALARSQREAIPLHAIGVSLGGSILLGALPAVQDRLATATLIVAPLRIVLSAGSLLNEIGLPGLRLLLREREHYGLGGLIPSFGPFKRDIYPLRLATEPPAGAFGYVEALNAELASLRLEACAAEVAVPTLLIYGGRDKVVPATQGEQLARTIRSGRLHTIAGGTHLTTPLEPSTVDLVMNWVT